MLSALVNTFRVLSSPAMIVDGSTGGTKVDDADIDLLPEEEKRMGWTVRRRKYEELIMVGRQRFFDASRSPYRTVRPHCDLGIAIRAMEPVSLQCFLRIMDLTSGYSLIVKRLWWTPNGRSCGTASFCNHSKFSITSAIILPSFPSHMGTYH
jgi:hypothetical protein